MRNFGEVWRGSPSLFLPFLWWFLVGWFWFVACLFLLCIVFLFVVGGFSMHHPTDRIAHTTAFVTPVVEHWLL